jgi:hypothetical protein
MPKKETRSEEEHNSARLQAINRKLTWVEAKKLGLIKSPAANFIPKDEMFETNNFGVQGYFYPTACYTRDRNKRESELLPILYDIDYAIAVFNEKLIRDLSLENQLILLRAINALYTDSPVEIETVPQVDIKDCIDSFDDVTRLQLCKDIAKSLGKRVIANK